MRRLPWVLILSASLFGTFFAPLSSAQTHSTILTSSSSQYS